MRITCNLCLLILVGLGICGGVLAFTGFNLLLFLCFFNQYIYRSILAIGAVAGLFTVYALLIFKPFKGLK